MKQLETNAFRETIDSNFRITFDGATTAFKVSMPWPSTFLLDAKLKRGFILFLRFTRSGFEEMF
jgi:hypothetical protein